LLYKIRNIELESRTKSRNWARDKIEAAAGLYEKYSRING
jgi:hypothetical protein